jgi:uncharacterized membrane protein YfcA
MSIAALPAALAVGSGAAIGLVLGLVGGGGSILAVPLLVYLVGVSSPHEAIGTAAIAVALNAAVGLIRHARQGTVKWNCAVVFALAGTVGSALGAAAGKAMDGQRLLALFGIVMVAVGLSMLLGKGGDGDANVRLTRISARRLLPWLILTGLGVGLLSGFFGIGGGFLIVPALMVATGMPITNAVGTSLVAVTAFGLTTAASYAASGFVNWNLVGLLVVGGIAGSFAATWLSSLLATRKTLLTRLFAISVIAVGTLVAARGWLVSA